MVGGISSTQDTKVIAGTKKSLKKYLCITSWGRLVLQILLNIVTNYGISVITNWDKCFYKLGQLFQIGALLITKWAAITNLDKIYYKLVQLL